MTVRTNILYIEPFGISYKFWFLPSMRMVNEIKTGCKGAHLIVDYARVSTKEQSFDLQVDARYRAGCKKVYKEIVSRARAERQALNHLLVDDEPELATIAQQMLRQLGYQASNPGKQHRSATGIFRAAYGL